MAKTKKQAISRAEVKHVAALAKLPLTTKEITKFQKQLSDILTYVSQLKKLNTSQVEPASQVTGLENVTRPDKTSEKVGLNQKQALSNAPQKHDGYFQVKGIFDEA